MHLASLIVVLAYVLANPLAAHSLLVAQSQPSQAQPAAEPAPPPPLKDSAETPKLNPSTKTKFKKCSGSPKRVVVKEGGAPEPEVQLAPGMTGEQETHQRLRTDQLLSSTDANLKQILQDKVDAKRQDTISQIRTFMDQARAAVKAGDLQRGHNLALKAHLLSDDLLVH